MEGRAGFDLNIPIRRSCQSSFFCHKLNCIIQLCCLYEIKVAKNFKMFIKIKMFMYVRVFRVDQSSVCFYDAQYCLKKKLLISLFSFISFSSEKTGNHNLAKLKHKPQQEADSVPPAMSHH